MHWKIFFVFLVAVVANSLDITPAMADQPGWTIGVPAQGSTVGRAANIACSGRAPAVGLVFTVTIVDFFDNVEQSVNGQTGGIPMPGNATWMATAVPPVGQSNLWTRDVFAPPPAFKWLTQTRLLLVDVDNTALTNSFVFVN